ncbi:MAG: winged helix-turn-helix domain-containing protein [Steroidobacteraceae bacterium]
MSAERFRFDEFELDRSAFELRRAGRSVHLERIPFELLCLLVERSGRLVTRGEILESIWGKAVYLDESAVTTAVRKVRLALGDNPEVPRFILTVPAKGYRFIARVEAPEPVTPKGADSASELSAESATATAAHDRSRKIALLLVSVAILSVSIGLVAFRHRHRSPALTEKDTIVLADFSNSTGDPVFDGALKQGLAVELGQSPVLNVLSDERVRSTLLEMTRPRDESLTEIPAREVCERTGSKAYIVGSIANLGGQYVIGLSAMDCATGDPLAREQTEARDKQHVLEALGRAADRVRVKLGESLLLLQRFHVPLAEATTSSLDALEAYSLGVSKWGSGDQAGSIPLFQRAIELDPDFAMAYANLGRAYQVIGQGPLSNRAFRRAFELRNRASEREKFDISAAFYQFVTMQTDQTILNCEIWEQTYPRDSAPHRILGFETAVLGNYQRSAEEFRKAMELDPNQALPYAGLMADFMALNRLPDARAVYEEAQIRKVYVGEPQYERYLMAFLEGDRQMMANMAVSQSRVAGRQLKTLLEQGDTAAYGGHLRAAQESWKLIEDKALHKADRALAADIESAMALQEALCGDLKSARDHSKVAAKLGGRPALPLALSGELAGAARAADQLARENPPGGFVEQVGIPETRAAIEIERDNPTKAVEILASTAPYEAGWIDSYRAAYLRGEAYLAAHQGRLAAVEFQKILDHPGVVLNSLIGALAHLQIARAYAMQGDFARAGTAYRSFLTLWNYADPDIPILQQAKAEYARLH